jgi:hypothetical protein
MQGRPDIRIKHALAGVAVMGAAAVATLIAGWDANSAHTPQGAPTDAVAERFPAAWNGAAPAPAPVAEAAFDAAGHWLALWSPNPTYANPSSSPSYALASAPPEPRDLPGKGAAHSDRRRFVLNDAQIASIKDRLKLTPAQHRHWPAVEAALRGLAWPRTARKGERPKIDPNSRDVQRLKSAAAALMEYLDDAQKREVRVLAHLIGLSRVVAAEF